CRSVRPPTGASRDGALGAPELAGQQEGAVTFPSARAGPRCLPYSGAWSASDARLCLCRGRPSLTSTLCNREGQTRGQVRPRVFGRRSRNRVGTQTIQVDPSDSADGNVAATPPG